MDYAIDKQQMVKDTRYTLLGNELVLIAAKSDKHDKIAIDKQTDWANLLSGGRLAVGDPDHVPAGIYAKRRWSIWAPGACWSRSWRAPTTCAARWRWWNAVKRRSASSTALMRSPATR